jgi:hypothetical protein
MNDDLGMSGTAMVAWFMGTVVFWAIILAVAWISEMRAERRHLAALLMRRSRNRRPGPHS